MNPKGDAASAETGAVDDKALAPDILSTPSSAGQRAGRRFALPLALGVTAASIGFFAGVYASGSIIAFQEKATAPLVAETRAQAATIAALAERLKALEEAPRADAAVKPAIDILARRIDEIGRTQTAALTQTRSRFERAEADMGQKIDKLGERLDRVEKQVSAATPVGSIQPARSTAAGRLTSVGAPLRGYVLREVFRDGGALVEGREGVIEVFPGVELPGAGRVSGLERRDGRWVVVTSSGVIEAHR
jgi:hypothetical protein